MPLEPEHSQWRSAFLVCCPHVPRFSVSELDRGEDRSKDQHKGWESMKERQYLLEQRPSELNAHILVALHVEKVEGLLAA